MVDPIITPTIIAAGIGVAGMMGAASLTTAGSVTTGAADLLYKFRKDKKKAKQTLDNQSTNTPGPQPSYTPHTQQLVHTPYTRPPAYTPHAQQSNPSPEHPPVVIYDPEFGAMRVYFYPSGEILDIEPVQLRQPPPYDSLPHANYVGRQVYYGY